jgi:predicted nucleic acid-binding protein
MVIVCDTHVLVVATLSPFGTSFAILAMVPQQRFALLLSVPLMREYEEVLKRDDMEAQSHLHTRHFLPAARTFGVEILRPGAFLRSLRT